MMRTKFSIRQQGALLLTLSVIYSCSTAKHTSSKSSAQKQNMVELALPAPTPMPPSPAPLPVGSVPMGDTTGVKAINMDFPMAKGPFEPTWNSIAQHYQEDAVSWLREAKFGIWVHFGPQASGLSGDWFARKMYIKGTPAYENHLKKYGSPVDSGYKDMLHEWNPKELDPAKLVKLYHDIGARFLLIQGVHHDNFDLWNSKYQPWNSVNIGPHKDLLGEWSKAVKQQGMHFGIAFHHEYTWWWWQTAYRTDDNGKMYDGRLTLADGKGKWWEGYDPKLLYGINLREYKGMDDFMSKPDGGIFTRHLDYAKWYVNRWALRILDAVNKYDPDFVYTDGDSKQPFSGDKTGTGIRSDADQRMIASYFNLELARRGKQDVFSITKFFPAGQKGIVTTMEGHFPAKIKTDQPWMGENAVGDWYYAPGFIYDPNAVIHCLLENVCKDGAYAVSIPIRPDGSLEPACLKMLHEIGDWMKINGSAIYGSKAWVKFGEGKDGKISVLPSGNLGSKQSDFKFGPEDLRFTVGKDGSLNVFTMMVPPSGSKLIVRSLNKGNADYKAISSVRLLGYNGKIDWTQDENGLHITLPDTEKFKTALCFSVN
ncbi:alpha-L-fucosidase [Mucilaginibacter yixingensis]|uniref:alpha-L-fucosidase n=1 Tax=Mucilaginibacter yixingensis TaxID=1295612 RepID=A0A2T5JG81_9SPHI|nr:alpha-L-fucosidase [Mucilaginibacter yixingensis]PTR01421.1 alpha-L-fucosidase [Mucilaginibacter yixingensis]